MKNANNKAQHDPNLNSDTKTPDSAMDDVFGDEQEDNDYNDENATTTWSLGLVFNIILNGLLWFCVVLSFY